jgi:SAM-dependent methyltransferase
MFDTRVIPPSTSDRLLRSWGYDLVAEYAEMVTRARFDPAVAVVELATGSGRMTAVLTHMGFRVITGDRTHEQRLRVFDRLTTARDRAALVGLEMGRLPFRDNGLRNITCVNTLHEIDDPRSALEELLRVRHPHGRLLIADFNERGFDVMQRLEQEVYRRDHPRGAMPMAEVERVLQTAGLTYERFETKLNAAVVGGGRLRGGAPESPAGSTTSLTCFRKPPQRGKPTHSLAEGEPISHERDQTAPVRARSVVQQSLRVQTSPICHH